MSNQFALCGDCTIRLVDQNGRSFWYVEKYCKKCFKEIKKSVDIIKIVVLQYLYS